MMAKCNWWFTFESSINLAKNPMAYGRSKHIETQFHFLRDQVSKGKLSLAYCKSEQQLVRAFDKASKEHMLRDKLGVVSLVNT